MKILPAQQDDWSAIRAMLAAATLPVADLGPDKLQEFLVARDDVTGRDVVGLIGLERYGEMALLRSLVVAPGERRSGLGASLVGALEARAAQSEIRDLYLITIDADSFFSRMGFAPVGRGRVPQAIRDTSEFSELCPIDAIVMRKVLRDT